MRIMRLLLVVASHFSLMAGAFSIDTPNSSNPLSSSILSRRAAAIGGAALVLGLATLPNLAVAETDLSMYSDLSNGIKFLITKEGEGEKPLRARQVFTKYSLWTGGFPEDGGKQVDSNTGFFGQPLSVIVGVGKVIKGWDLALLDMKEGEARRLVIPSEVGYGSKGAGGAIPPNAKLYFEVEIVSMDKMPDLNESQLKWLEANPL
jgi:peptidylprolyl isomerase